MESGIGTISMHVSDDSMKPLFFEGEKLVVNVGQEPGPNDYVVVMFDEDKPWLFRQFKRIEKEEFLHPLNPKYEDTLITPDMHVYGKVIRSQREW